MSPRKAAPREQDVLPDGDPASIVRRAPFVDSPFVGERGQRAQIRILEAALEVFGEVGYHGCGVKRITELSGYSRASFYQYFSSKEDLFRHLAGRVALALRASADELGPITGDQAGWDQLHRWLARDSAIYDAYEPVFVTFQTAVASDAMVASGSSLVFARSFSDLRSKVEGSPLDPDDVDTVVRGILQTVARLNREAELLESAAPKSWPNRDRLNTAFADTLHRALFGPIDGVNVHPPGRRIKALPPVGLPTGDAGADGQASHGPAAERTRTQLLDAGHKVFVERGYYATRVADVVKAAGVSHGVFYRYFDNKASLFKILAAQASAQLEQALDGFPDLTPGDDVAGQLREWLATYATTYAEEASIFTMWSEAISRDDDLDGVSATVIDGSRARLARHLAARGWGDADADALVLLVYLDAMTATRRGRARIESMARLIELGLLAAPGARRRPARKAAKSARR